MVYFQKFSESAVSKYLRGFIFANLGKNHQN